MARSRTPVLLLTSNPSLAADILGDWREEVIARTPDSSELRIFVSPVPTDYRINCLMEDIPYRLSTAAQNVGYNQPSETGFYLGPDKTVNPFRTAKLGLKKQAKDLHLSNFFCIFATAKQRPPE